MNVEAAERLSEWSPTREGLARIEDAVRALNAAVIAAAGPEPPKFLPAVRPIAAADEARVRRRRRRPGARASATGLR